MSAKQQESYDVLGPGLAKVSVFAVTASSSHKNLTSEAIAADMNAGRVITLKADGVDIWYRWSTATSGETVDETATTGNDRCQILFDGERVDERPPYGCQGIVIKGRTATGYLRMHVSSRDPASYAT